MVMVVFALENRGESAQRATRTTPTQTTEEKAEEATAEEAVGGEEKAVFTRESITKEDPPGTIPTKATVR